MGPGETAAKKRVIGLDSRFLAWALCAVALALISGTVVLAVLNARDLDNVTFSIVGISGAVVGYGQRLGVPTPVNDFLLRAIRNKEKVHSVERNAVEQLRVLTTA